MSIQRKGYDGEYVLVDRDDKPVQAGATLTDKWGDVWTVDDGAAPHNIASTGKVDVTHLKEGYGRTFYPSVLGLRWAKIEG